MGAFIAVAVISIGALGFAQTANTLSCSVEAGAVNTNQAAIVTAIGGNGIYAWPTSNPGITTAAGNQFAVSYPNPGDYPITVTSGNQTATCDVSVVAIVTPNTLACAPAVQNVMLGQVADISATGGDGAYGWSSPYVSVPTQSGSTFSEQFPATGLKIVTVISANLITACIVNVLPNGGGNASGTVPGLPNTGGGYDH